MAQATPALAAFGLTVATVTPARRRVLEVLASGSLGSRAKAAQAALAEVDNFHANKARDEAQERQDAIEDGRIIKGSGANSGARSVAGKKIALDELRKEKLGADGSGIAPTRGKLSARSTLGASL